MQPDRMPRQRSKLQRLRSTGCGGLCQAASLSLADADAGFLDDRCPFVHLRLEKRRKLLRRRAHHQHAQLLEPLLGRWVVQRRHGVGMDLFNDLRRRLGRRKNAYHEETSKPGTPASAIGGRCGTAGIRLAVVTARPRSLPPWISGSTAPILLNITSTRPGKRSLSAGPAPRYGTCSISMPAMRLNSSPERCTEVP